ncbi:MAG TPA: bifunctional 2',3'-cyclic-nucleotide 2'-phosphodiesterase/3'-nucleotidase [Rudaea sp.]|nr:bifunctional 2',3'-cyclic-nucleotide 2'-phosphodiesterase/3'-nucleotidase [Rudaea sp.]
MTRRLVSFLAVAALAACGRPDVASMRAALPDGTQAEIGVLETTDLHSNLMSYDYYKLAEDDSLGLDRAATLIRQARKEFENSLLFDAGDTIQGTALADYQAMVKPPPCNEELAVYRAMDTLGYDAGTIGNHEFNYGLGFLSQVTGTPFDVAGAAPKKCKGPAFPFVLSNVVSAKDGKPLYAPWRIIERTMRTHTPDGGVREATLRIGLLGFTPPMIMQWDKRNLDGKVKAIGVVEAAQRYVPEVQRAGADIVVAIVHGGISTAPYTPDMENAAWYLAQVPGIDLMLLGHSHDIFPNPNDAKSRFAHVPDVDDVRGAVHGVPAVMGNYFGKSIGVIDLKLAFRDGRWTVDRAATHAEVRSVKNADGSYVAVDPEVAAIVRPQHEATIAYVKTPIGNSDFAMSTYFVADEDTTAIGIVNAAQRAYVEKYVKENLPQYAAVPVLSAASPFKAGFGGPRDYTDVPAGALTIASAADLYLYPNTITAVKLDGAGVRAWLEKSAAWFNRIDPGKREPQELVNTKVPTYNFDILQGGLSYTIDVTKPLGERIGDLAYHGRPVRSDEPFLVVTNNYRASGGGKFPGLDGSTIVLSAPDANRDALIAFIRGVGTVTRAEFGSERNWRFARVKTAGPVVFTSAAGKLDLARGDGVENVALWKDNGDGTAVYAIDLSR